MRAHVCVTHTLTLSQRHRIPKCDHKLLYIRLELPPSQDDEIVGKQQNQQPQRNSINIVRNVCTHTLTTHTHAHAVWKRQSRTKYRTCGRIVLVCMSKISKLVYLFKIIFTSCFSVSQSLFYTHILVSFAFTMPLLRMHACFIYSVTLDNDV